MMSGALEGKPVENFNTVHIPDSKPRDRGDGDDGGRGDGGNDDDGGNGGNDGFIGGLVGGNNGGGGGEPTPSFSIPEGFFRGQGNGGGNGNGGRFG
jgi:hypothetical protein